MIVAVFLFVDVGGHFVKTDFLDDTVVKAHCRGFFAIFNRRYDRCDRHNADRKNLLLQNRVDQCTFAALELPDNGDRNFLVFQFIAKLLRARKLALRNLILAENFASLFHYLCDRPFFPLLRGLHLQTG